MTESFSNHGLPDFDPQLTPEDQQVIREEQAILEAVLGELAESEKTGAFQDRDQDLLDLRDSLGEASRDDTAQIIAQMDTISNLSSHLRMDGGERPFDPASPYFGHLQLDQGGRKMDVLIGNGTRIRSATRYPIIDWRNAPISKLYYTYREGDEYEEEFAERMVEGTVLAHRRLMILQGRLMRIECLQGSYRVRGNRWEKTTGDTLHLSGGAGSAIRPGTVEPLTLGVAHDGIDLEDRHLQSITSLIDPNQFDLITRPDSGIVVIDGGAGSGKTTIALHRIAYLAYRSPEVYRTENMMVVVFNRALATYISRLLPALGVAGVRIEVFEDFVETLRRRHFPMLGGEYCETTPWSVVRFKHHPAALALLEEHVANMTDDFTKKLSEILAGTDAREQAIRAWESLEGEPFVSRLTRFFQWIGGRSILPGVGGFEEDWLAQTRVRELIQSQFPDRANPASVVIGIWEEAFINLDRLRDGAERFAPGEFSESNLKEIRDWCQHMLAQREDFIQWQKDKKQGDLPDKGEEGEDDLRPGQPQIDREDDALLLLLHRVMIGELRNRRKNPLKLRHLMIDEAQDFSPIDLHLLLGLATEDRSVTLAGDTDQRMILHNSFDTWEDVLGHLGLEGTAVSPLMVGYRSTEEIMAFSRSVLGELATERPWIPTRKGVPVSLLRFTDTGQAIAVLSDALLALMRKEPNAYVALIARYPAQADLYFNGLERTEIPRLNRVNEQNFLFQPGIEVTDVTQVKGLEFDYVILLDVDIYNYPDEDQARYLLHIGATRAAHQLWVVSCKTPSPILPNDLEPVVL